MQANGRVTRARIVKNRLSPELDRLAQLVRAAGQALPPEQKQDFVAAANRVSAIAEELELWLDQPNEGYVHWIDVTRNRSGRPRLQLQAAPVDVGSALQTALFQAVDTVIMTSATLATGGEDFSYFQSQVGITGCETLCLGSPFDYRRQARLVLVRDMPDPTRSTEDYTRLCVTMIERHAGRTEGRTFALFTSYKMLREVATRLRPWAADREIEIFSQADGLDRTKMLERFKANTRSILLGTDSFWQGVDVPGDALQTVIITKLPFSVPDQPLLAARLDAIRAAGGNPFREYQVPEAIIKLRQGFGRLIRSRRDRGTVVILDPRIRSKPYGRLFVESLPDCELIDESLGGEAETIWE